MLAVPALILAIFGIIFFLRPSAFPRKEAIGVLFFTMLVGLAGLLIFQSIADFTLHHMPDHPRGKIGLIVVIVAAIGQAYNSIGSTSAIEQFFGFIFGVGLCEEATKLLPLFFFAFAREDFSSNIKFREFLVVAFFSGLGFGIGEALYGFSPWSGNLMAGSNVIRWFACVPSHAIYTVIDAAFLWLLIPIILGSKNNYIRFAICVLTVLTVAVVHGIYDVLCRFQYMGFIIDAASMFLMYFVVVWVAKKTGDSVTIQEHEGFSTGIVGWLKNSKGGQMRFGRIYLVSSLLIMFSLVFFSSADSLETSLSNTTEPSSTTSRGGSQQTGNGFEVRYVSRPIYELYMQGYNNPAAANLAREMLSMNSNRENTVGGMKDKMIVIGADDRLAGLPIRLIAN
jgi:RsiW-degrading membrane proteinase PrsW (M82 family)